MDYSKSAVNLCNPPELEIKLLKYRDMQVLKENTEAKIKALIPQELKSELELKESELNTLYQEIKETIDKLGSYQNLDNGMTAVKQRKVSKSYDAELFEKIYPQFSPAVIVKAVDTTKLNGLIKGKLVDELLMKEQNIIKEKESFSYIIQ